MIALLDSPKVDVAAVADALEGLRARGAIGQAYLQTDGRDVCVNAVNGGEEGWPEYSEAVSRRAATRGRRLLPVLDRGEVDGRFWIAYDMGSTTSLPKYRGDQPLPTATSIRVLSDVARALDEAAGVGFFPSELPPDSVFVSRRGARLGDLGTAREAIAGATFELGGDPAFVPPEVLHGERAGERSGVYLFGALLYHLITGASPRRSPSTPLAGPRPDLPVSIKSIVATVMADDPGGRPATAAEAYDMAKRALRGEPPARAAGGRRRVRGAKQEVAPRRVAEANQAAAPRPGGAPAPQAAAPKQAVTAAAPKPAARRKPNAIAPKSPPAPKPKPQPVAPMPNPTGESPSWQWPSRSAGKPATAKPPAAPTATSKLAATKQDTPQPAARTAAAEEPVRRKRQAQRRRPNVSAASSRRSSTSEAAPGRRLRAVAVAGAILLGATAGLLLGRSPDPEPARAQSVARGGLAVTLPPGWHPVDRGAVGLSAQAESGVGLHARLVDRPLELQEDYKPMRLGAFEVWHHAASGAAVYTSSTSAGTLIITCKASASVGSGPLRECERAASTLRLRGGRALPLSAALEDSERLRTVVAAMGAQRDRARTRLGRASTPRGQRLLAQDLARIHSRAATALDGLAKAASIKAAVRRAADAYSSLAASVESGSAWRWEKASERVSRSEAMLAQAIANAD